MEDKKMKKAIVMVPALLLGIPAVLVGTLYAMFLTRPVAPSSFVPEEISNEDLMKRQVVRLFDNTETEQKLEFTIDENVINQLLYNIKEEAMKNVEIPQEITDAIGLQIGDLYATVNGNNYDFHFNVDSKYFKTGLSIETTLKSDAIVDGKEAYEFAFKNVRVGRAAILGLAEQVGLLQSLESSAEDIEKSVSEAGLSLKVDIPNKRMYWFKDDAEKDLRKLMSDDSGEGDSTFTSILEATGLNLDFKDGIRANASLSKLVDNAELTDSAGHDNAAIRDELKTIRKTVSDAVVAGTISSDNVEDAFDALLKSSDVLHPTVEDDVNSVVEEQVKENAQPANYGKYIDTEGQFLPIASVDESVINEVLKGSGLIGKKVTVLNYKEEIAYIVVDNIYSDLFVKNNEQYLNFTVGVNINGLETRAIIETKLVSDANKLACSFEIGDIHFGTHKLQSGLASTIREYMKDAIAGLANDWISYDNANDQLKVDFEAIFDTPEMADAKLAFQVKGSRRLVVKGDGVTSKGEFVAEYRS